MDKEAYCYSASCTGTYGSFHVKAIKKDVKKGTVDCPDCRSVLLWRKRKYRNIVKDINVDVVEKFAEALIER